MEKVFDSRDFPARDALGAWEEATSDTVMPTSFKLIGTEVFCGWLSTMSLGAAQVSAMAYSTYVTVRTPKLIRASDPEILAVGLTHSGSHVITQNRNRAALQPGRDLLLFESSRPFETYASGGIILLQFPRVLLPLPTRYVDQLICRPLPADQGIGRLLAAFLTHLADDSTSYTPQDAARLGTVGLDLVTATLAHFLDRDSDVVADSCERALPMRIISFIEQHLADPGLSPDMVAAAHHVSTRHLHRLFQQQGQTVAGWIRQRRLERCRRDLADPALRSRPVHVIASRWGFTDKSHFSRLFRAAYGVAPRDYQHRC